MVSTSLSAAARAGCQSVGAGHQLCQRSGDHFLFVTPHVTPLRVTCITILILNLTKQTPVCFAVTKHHLSAIFSVHCSTFLMLVVLTEHRQLNLFLSSEDCTVMWPILKRKENAPHVWRVGKVRRKSHEL